MWTSVAYFTCPCGSRICVKGVPMHVWSIFIVVSVFTAVSRRLFRFWISVPQVLKSVFSITVVYFSCQLVYRSIMDDCRLEKKEKKYYIIEQIPVVGLGANLSCCLYNGYILKLVIHLEPTLDICPSQP